MSRQPIDDFEADIDDVMQDAKPAQAARQERSPISQQLREFCSDVGLSIRQCHVTHWQILENGQPLMDFWPSTNRYRFNAAPPGAKARAGSQARIIQDLEEYCLRNRRTSVVIPPTRENIKRGGGALPLKEPEPRRDDNKLALLIATAVGQEVARQLRSFEERIAPAPAQPAKEPAQSWQDEAAVIAEELAEERCETTDPAVDPDDPWADHWAIAYGVALHALIIRADELDVEKISNQASLFAWETRAKLMN